MEGGAGARVFHGYTETTLDFLGSPQTRSDLGLATPTCISLSPLSDVKGMCKIALRPNPPIQ